MRTRGFLFLWLIVSISLKAQTTSGTVRGNVLDPSGAAIAGATVEIQNPVSHYDQTTKTDRQGAFAFNNIPFNNYHATAAASGFQTGEQDIDLRSLIPVEVKFSLVIGAASSNVTVEAGADLVETDPEIHTDVDRNLFEKLPLESQSSSLSSLVTLATPGVSADSNGLFHGLGDHAQNSFSIDGQPITDQQSKVFSNQLPVDAVQSMEVIEGAPPAEYGDKTSLVIVATTRSGLGQNVPHGQVDASFGSFGTYAGGFNLSYGSDRWGNFISANGLGTQRFLDGPEFATMHDNGNQQNVFDRFDWKPSQSDAFSLNVQFTRSWFQTPSSYDMQNATAWTGLVVDNSGIGPDGLPVGATDQRAKIRTFDIAPSWTHVVNPNMVLTAGLWARQDQFNYYPSTDPFADFVPDLQSATIGQNRRLTNLGGQASVSWHHGIHNFKAGIQWYDDILTERDSFGIVDPTFNAVCLNGDGSPNTNPLLTDPNGCGGALQPNPSYDPLLACVDLTRTGPLPAANGCPSSTAARYTFSGHANVRQLSPYVEDLMHMGNWTLRLGLRGDYYYGITKAGMGEPRVGVSYNIKPTNTVLSVSYARTMETPFNENLILSSLGCNDAVVNDIMASIQGYPCLTSPLKPGKRNEFHAGIQQAFGRFLVISGEYIWKYTDRAYDFSVFANTPITYPIEWAKSKIPGFALRASVPNYHGFSAFVVMSSVAARFFGPQISGIGTTPTSFGAGGVFRIDHDETFNATTHLQYQIGKRGPWIGFNWRFDSGLVAGAIPCAGGNCANGPNGTDTVVDVSNLTPDQQFEAGLFCAGVYATPTTPISPTGLCAANQYGSTKLKIPAPGTENDDHNPPRVASRNLFDLAIGHDNLFHGDRYKWSTRLEIINLTNADVLYNFLSTFSGTHYVTPRTFTGTVAFHF
ncbi:MAG TPA: TonB-dependent receptor [Bryobacteraceae bacterium]|nr:TonB-dependent receptor [Bryobacteraceae bacterium]